LQVGEAARVVPGGSPNRLRDQPGTSATQVGQVPPGSSIDVLAGPVCDAAASIIWWQVRFRNVTGWTAEGLYPDNYFLEPLTDVGIASGATAVAQATLNTAATANARSTAAVLDATRSQQTAVYDAATLLAASQTAQALITPSATSTITPTPSVTPTPTITPTPEPVRPLPLKRAVITPDNARALTTLTSLPFAVGGILFLPDQSQMVLNGSAVYDLPAMTRSDHFGAFPLSMGSVITISPDARYLAYIVDGAVRIYDMQTRESFTLPNIGTNVVISGGPAYKLAYAYGESYGNTDQPQLLLYDLTTRTLIFQIDNPAAFGAEIAFNRDGSRIASTGGDIRIISIQPRPRWVVPTAGFSSGDIAYRPVPPNQSEQVAFGVGKAIKLFDLARGTGRLFPLTASSTAGRIAFSPDGRLMAAVGEELEGDPFSGEPRFNLFDVDTGDLLLDSSEYRGGFAFSPDGTLLVVSDRVTRILGVAP
jgi:hypothetical protein